MGMHKKNPEDYCVAFEALKSDCRPVARRQLLLQTLFNNSISSYQQQ